MMTENTPYLIAGLGNPGPKYRHNRHNIGFMVLDAFAEYTQIPIQRVQFRTLVGKGHFHGARLVLAKPQTYMNVSGQAVVPLMKFYKIPPELMMVVHDDLDLPFMTLRLRPEGGAGGQHGVESIINKLDRRDFARLRIGIGRPPGRMDPRDYVLHDFDPPEVEFLPAVLQHAVDAIISFIQDGIEKAMNDFNGNVISEG
ncbi:MAG: aminoacyl-tRNA hydrolase [Chloroflexota bacterium]|nr:aminoacyl-tRNA hydrolase [Chloroflexota bacterium]